MTRTQYDAIQEIAENGERFRACDLNIRPQTFAAIAKRGWVEIVNSHAFVTYKGWQAVAAL